MRDPENRWCTVHDRDQIAARRPLVGPVEGQGSTMVMSARWATLSVSAKPGP